MGHLAHFEWHTVCHVSSIKFSQLELKVGPMLTHDMKSLGGKVKVVGLSG